MTESRNADLGHDEAEPTWSPVQFLPPVGGEQPHPPHGARRLEGLTYAAISGYRPLLMDVYVPEGVAAAACVIWVHGGAWLTGDRRLPCAAWPPGALFQKIIDAGLAVATIDYRHSREAPFPAQLHDAKAAIRYVRAFADSLHLDPDRIALWGESAGAQLAVLTALSAGRPELEGSVGVTGPSSAVAAVVDWYGRAHAADPREKAFANVLNSGTKSGFSLEMPMEILLDGSPLGPEAIAEASPTLQAHTGAPPFLVMHGDADRLLPVAHSEALAERLREVGVDVDFRRVPGADHVFLGRDPLPLMDDTIAWLKERLG